MYNMVDSIIHVALGTSVRKNKKYDGYFEDEYSALIKKSKEIIVLDVGGKKFDVFKSIFAIWPTTRLSSLIRARTVQQILSLCDGFYPRSRSSDGKTEYFFNRNWTSFNSVLDIYRCGRLHRIRTGCAMTYHKDLEYWGFNELFLDPCCATDYFVEKDNCQNELEVETNAKKKASRRLLDENFGNSFIGRARTYLWNLTEYPETTIGARVR